MQPCADSIVVFSVAQVTVMNKVKLVIHEADNVLNSVLYLKEYIL